MQTPDPRKLQLSLTGFLESKTPVFMSELWTLLLSAQKSVGGIPQEFVERKKQELREAREKDAGAIRDSGVIHYQGRAGAELGSRAGERGRGRGRGRGGSRWDGGRSQEFRDRQGNVTQRVQDSGWVSRALQHLYCQSHTDLCVYIQGAKGPRGQDDDRDRNRRSPPPYRQADYPRRRSPSPRYDRHREDRYDGYSRDAPRGNDGSRSARPRYDDEGPRRYYDRRPEEDKYEDRGKRRSPSPDPRRYRSPTYSPDALPRRPKGRSASFDSRSPSPRPVYSRRRRSPSEDSRSPSPSRAPRRKRDRSESYAPLSPSPPRRSLKRRDSYSDSEEEYRRRTRAKRRESSEVRGDQTPDYRQRSKAKAAARSPSDSSRGRSGSKTPVMKRRGSSSDSPERSRDEAEARARALASRKKQPQSAPGDRLDKKDEAPSGRSGDKSNVLAKSKWATSDDED